MPEKYTNGWATLTKAEWERMNNTISNQLPCWCRVSSGLGFNADETLRANGIHPDFVPCALRGK